MTANLPKRFSFYATALGLLLLTWFALIGFMADSLAQKVTAPLNHPVCCQTPADFPQGSGTGAGASYQKMTFQTADGLALSGWYVPPRNGAVIILIHSYYADRRQTLPVARMLYQAGYGLLMYDQRASGESQGAARSLGWRDIPDLGAAAQWLAGQGQALKIGVYGCSVGGAIALAGSTRVPSIQAIAADAPSPLGWAENLPAFDPQAPFDLPVMALYYPLVMLRSQSLPPASTLQAIEANGARPILFISSGQGEEYTRVNSYYAASQGPREHWNIPETTHCAGPSARPQEYQQHLLDFFNANLH